MYKIMNDKLAADKLREKLDGFLDNTMELNELPGLAVGVSMGGTGSDMVEHVCTRGYRDYYSKTPLEPDDIFHCASVSKLFTSTAVMKLVEAGAFSLYDRICDLLPLLDIQDKRFREIRLWNMLTHTSGLGDVSDYHWDEYETDKCSLQRYVYGRAIDGNSTLRDQSDLAYNETAPDQCCFSAAKSGRLEVNEQPMLWLPQVSPEFYGVPETDENGDLLVDDKGNPKNLFRYSNVAFEILGELVSEYSDRLNNSGYPNPVHNSGLTAAAAGAKLSYEDFVAEYLMKPAGMTSSTMKTFERCDFNSVSERDACSMASPHMKDDNRNIVPVEFYPYNRYHAPSSTLTANVRDLLRWGRAHIQAAAGKHDYSVFSVSARDQHKLSPVLNRETYDSIWREYATVPNNGEKMCLGWFTRRQRGYTLHGHEGTDDGFRASFWICPELELVTVVLSNMSGAPVKKINKRLFDLLCTSAL